MSDNVVKLTFWARLKNEVSAGFNALMGGVGAQLKRAGGLFSTLNANVQSLGGNVGKVARSVGGLLEAFRLIGPAGAAMVAVGKITEIIGDKFRAAADKMVEVASSRQAKVSQLLQDLKAHIFDVGDSALKKVTTEAERASKAFEALANAYLKVAKAKDATAKAGDDAAIAGMRRDKAQAMNAAGNRDASAVAGADWDVKIARAELEAVQREAEAAAQRVRDEAEQNRMRLEAATAQVEAAKIALAQAKEDEAFTRDATNLEEEHKHAMQNLATAEKTMADAINARVAAQANFDASGEAVKQAEYSMAAKLANATASVENAIRTRKELLEAQKKAQEAAQKREEEEAKRKAEAEAKARQRREYAQLQREAQERLSSTQVAVGDAQRQAEASQRQADTAWSWYRSPSAWQSQRQEEQDEAKAQRQFARDLERLQKRQDWRTAQLGDKDELVRRVALAREQAEFDKERLKLMQADLSEAASALDAIKNTIANGVEL